MNMKNILTTFTAACIVVIGVIDFLAVICMLLAWPFMWMWNYAVVQAISVANPISYWPAFWLMAFISIFVTAMAFIGIFITASHTTKKKD
jgi:hypothetical protein